MVLTSKKYNEKSLGQISLKNFQGFFECSLKVSKYCKVKFYKKKNQVLFYFQTDFPSTKRMGNKGGGGQKVRR